MIPTKELSGSKKHIKGRKPNFTRQDAHKKAKLGAKWRKSRGLHSKIRLGVAGRAKGVSQGYRSPKKTRGLHKSGLQRSLIRTITDLDKLNPKGNCIIISSSLGNKKRVEILKKAKEKNFDIVNIKNPEDYIKKVEGAISLRKKAKQESKEKLKPVKSEKKESKEEAGARTKSGIHSVDSGTHSVGKEDEKEAEKKEKDQILTKKEM